METNKANVIEFRRTDDFMSSLKDNRTQTVFFDILNEQKEVPIKVKAPKKDNQKEEEIIDATGVYQVSRLLLTAISPDFKQNFIYSELLFNGIIMNKEEQETVDKAILARVEAVKQEFQRFYGSCKLVAGVSRLI